MRRAVGLFFAWALAVASIASAFHSPLLAPPNDGAGIRSISRSSNNGNAPRERSYRHRHRHRHRRSTVRPSRVSLLAEEEEEQEQTMVDFFVSPVQIAYLRKEANKRESNRRLVRYNLDPQETTTASHISPDTIRDISNLFDTSELVEVRGISKDTKKRVFDAAHGLAGTLEEAFERPVVVVDIKGYAAKLYCPWDDDDDDDESGTGRDGRIQLRSNYRPGQWTRKAKPIRDNRGQIITDEDGMSIKEIPED